MLLKFAGRTMKIQLVLWAVIALGAAWITAVAICLTTCVSALFAKVTDQQFSCLPIYAFGAIVLPTFLLLELAAYKAPVDKLRPPRLSYAEILVHLSLLVGGLGFWSGVLR